MAGGKAYLEVLDDVDDFPGWVRILNERLVCHVPQLTECPHQVPHGLLRHVGAIGAQKGHFRLHTWVVNGMTAEEVTCRESRMLLTMLYCINICINSVYVHTKAYRITFLTREVINKTNTTTNIIYPKSQRSHSQGKESPGDWQEQSFGNLGEKRWCWMALRRPGGEWQERCAARRRGAFPRSLPMSAKTAHYQTLSHTWDVKCWH